MHTEKIVLETISDLVPIKKFSNSLCAEKKVARVLFLSSTQHPFIEELAKGLAILNVETFIVYSSFANLKPLLRSPSFIINVIYFTIRIIIGNPRLMVKLTGITLRHVFFSPKRLLTLTYYLVIASLVYALNSRYKFDLIHSFWSYPAGISAVLARTVLRKPVVISVLGYDLEGKRTTRIGFFREISKLALEEAEAVIVAAEYHLSLLERMKIKSRNYFIPIGIDTNKFNPNVPGRYVREKYNVPESDVVVAFGPRLTELYNPEDFLEAALIVSRHAKNVTFIFFGEGSLRQKLERVCRAHGLKAIFTGKIPYDEMPFYYAACDVFCITSHAGQGVSALEAMASGKPVVGYKTGIVAITDGVDGFLIEEKNVKELAQKILVLVRDPELRKRMGENARRKVSSQHSIDVCANRILEVYLSIEKTDQLRVTYVSENYRR